MAEAVCVRIGVQMCDQRLKILCLGGQFLPDFPSNPQSLLRHKRVYKCHYKLHISSKSEFVPLPTLLLEVSISPHCYEIPVRHPGCIFKVFISFQSHVVRPSAEVI